MFVGSKRSRPVAAGTYDQRETIIRIPILRQAMLGWREQGWIQFVSPVNGSAPAPLGGAPTGAAPVPGTYRDPPTETTSRYNDHTNDRDGTY